MPKIKCPIESCDYETPDVDPVVAAALITTHATVHQASGGSTTPAARAEKVKRPSVSSAGTTEEWQYFILRWSDYVKATRLDGTDKIIQLLECCDDQLRKDLTRNAGGTLTGMTEEEVLKAMESLAVREENAMVARVTLHNMKQDRDEPVRSYVARLKGQASICKFTQKCTGCGTDVNYTDAMIKDVLCRGLEDTEIQMDLLGDKDQDMSLEKTLRFIEAKEAGKRSASHLLLPQSADVLSSHKKQKRKSPTLLKEQDATCSYCGTKGHGKNPPTRVRRTECPAFGVKCNHCGREHHFERVCRGKKQTAKDMEHSDAVFDMLCGITSTGSVRSATLDHHIFNQTTKEWLRKQSKPQPYIRLRMSINREDYDHFGFSCRAPQGHCFISAMADTGCQSCLAGFKVVKKLGLSTEDLIPVSLKMRAADNHDINILGATILRLSGRSSTGEERSTRQIVYITNSTDRLFLSREACVDLGIVAPHFPTIEESNETESVGDPMNAAVTTPPQQECHCPKRTKPPPTPTSLPYPTTEANREKFQQYLLDYYASSTFNTCEHQALPLMEGPPLRLMIDPQATPTAHHSPIPVPLHWQDEVKAGLDRDVRLGVLEPVPIGEPVTWCHRMVICAKKNGSPRRTIDFQPLNLHATRETHHTQSPFHQARAVPPGKKKTVFDAWNGYHSVPLHPNDRHFTTFITPWGRYRYRTAPQGYIASGDGYTRRYDEITSSIPNKTKCVDDTLLWSDNIKESFFQACNWLNVCGTHGITLNPDKFTFAKDEVEFAGFEITNNSVRPCKKFLRAIADFPTPQNLTDVRSWFGLVNQVSYTFSMTDVMLPFRDLLKPSNKFYWDDKLEQAFQKSKSTIIDEIKHGVTIFDKTKPTCLATDWSKHGIGFWLFQKHCSCPSNDLFCCKPGWKITLVGSRFTHAAESRYAPIEGEALAVADALDKARHFVLGCTNLTIAVDHRPLLKIFGDRSLDHISNTRLRNLKEKTLRYHFKMVHIPGVKNKTPDTLSRHPTGNRNPQKMILHDDIHSISDNITTPCLHIPTQLMAGACTDDQLYPTQTESQIEESLISSLNSTHTVNWEQVQTATSSDDNMLLLLSAIEDGIPDLKHKLSPSIREYHQFREHLYSVDGVIIYKDRIVIPPSLRQLCLSALHAAHQGTSTMIAKAESSIFWPGITHDIQTTRANCTHCNRMAPSQAAMPPVPPITPVYPFQSICCDYFHYRGYNYLVIVDRYSNWPIVERDKDGAQGLINALRQTFATYGIPDELASDGGPVFIANATTKFLEDWGVHHRLSSVAFPHSNCRAEVGVKTIKRMITGNTGKDGTINIDAFQKAILQYRNTPDPTTKLSPAICIFGRPIKDLIPVLPNKYRPHHTWTDSLRLREEALRHRHMIQQERWSEHTRALTPLRVGDRVRIQNQTGTHPNKWDRTGIVIEVRQYHQYLIRVDGSGRQTLRNRKFLRKYIPVYQPSQRRSILEDIAHLPPHSLPETPPPKIHPSTQPITPNVPTPTPNEPHSRANTDNALTPTISTPHPVTQANHGQNPSTDTPSTPPTQPSPHTQPTRHYTPTLPTPISNDTSTQAQANPTSQQPSSPKTTPSPQPLRRSTRKTQPPKWFDVLQKSAFSSIKTWGGDRE